MIQSISAHPDPLQPLIELLRGRRLVALAGAGCSTESGIPDYRGPEGTLRARTPIQYGEFVRRPEVRARYWARSAAGWPRMSRAAPNAAHRALAGMERGGVLVGVITQNVDGLHHAAGSQRVVELHGSLAAVRCLECGGAVSRRLLQDRLLELNPELRAVAAPAEGPVRPAPDGDAELPPEASLGLRVPDCTGCGGMLKPDVVFFGENVPRQRVEDAWRLFGEAEVLLVVGSSLTVYSGRRFIYRADKEGVPIAVVNQGVTRADPMATVKVSGRLGEVLPRLAAALGVSAGAD